MLFISPHPFLLIAGVVKEETDYHPANGAEIGHRNKIDIHFEPNAPQWAAEQAMANQSFQNIWRTLPEAANVRAYIGCYDTDAEAKAGGWGKCEIKKCGKDHTLKTHIEEALLDGVGSLYILAEEEKPLVPYPNYVKATTVVGRRTIEHVLEKVRALIDEDGYPAVQLRAFEEATGRAESAEIIAFLDTIGAGELVAA